MKLLNKILNFFNIKKEEENKKYEKKEKEIPIIFLFLTYLKKKDIKAYNAYINNLKKLKRTHFINEICFSYHRYNLYNLINYSFHWSETKEGFSYWRRQHEKWESFVYEHNLHDMVTDCKITKKEIYDLLK